MPWHKKEWDFFAAIYFAGKISLSNSCRSHFAGKNIYIYIGSVYLIYTYDYGTDMNQ